MKKIIITLLLILPTLTFALCEPDEYYCIQNDPDGGINPNGDIVGYVGLEKCWQWWPPKCVLCETDATYQGKCNADLRECNNNCSEIPTQSKNY